MAISPLTSLTPPLRPAVAPQRPPAFKVVPRQPAFDWGAPKGRQPQSVEEVIARLKTIRDDLARRQDARVVWATTYLIQTENTLKLLQQPGELEDPEFIRKLALRFAQYFFEAYDAYEAGDLARVSEPWRRVFEMAKQGNILTMESLVLSIDVHINYDLPRALADVGAKPGANQRDYLRYNKLFTDNMDEAKDKIVASYARKLGPIQPLVLVDKLLWVLDTKAALCWIKHLRDRAFERSQQLQQGDRGALQAMRDVTMLYIERSEAVSRNPIHRFLAKERLF